LRRDLRQGSPALAQLGDASIRKATISKSTNHKPPLPHPHRPKTYSRCHWWGRWDFKPWSFRGRAWSASRPAPSPSTSYGLRWRRA